MVKTKVSLEGIGEWEVFSPPTVYPPREDSLLLCKIISEFIPKPGEKALEIGCGSGIITMVLATLGWEVSACDLNPYAVSATRGNMDSNEIPGSYRITESGLGENLVIPEGTKLVVWNLPYLEREEDNNHFEKIEEIAWSDIPDEGWGGELLNFLESLDNVDEIVALLVMKTEPEGKSKVVTWEQKGWTSYTIGSERLGDEKIEIVAFWKTASGRTPYFIDTCSSTMDEVLKISDGDWVRVLSKTQTNGRGRKNSEWISEQGGLFATWKIRSSLVDKFSPGIIQTSVGAIVSTVLEAEMKWPNDILNKKGEKMGGVLVESSNTKDSGIRIGIGLNRFAFSAENQVTASGWEETLGDVDGKEVFNKIDRGLSAIFERRGFLPFPSKGSLVAQSWISLSKALSRGLCARLGGEIVRPTGLNELGELRVTGESVGNVDIGDLDIIDWFI